MKSLVTLILCGILLFPVEAAATEPLALLRDCCLRCHNATNAEAEIDLSSVVERPARLLEDFNFLDAVLAAVESEAMPPVDASPLLSRESRQSLVTWLKEQRAIVAKRTSGDPGPVPLQRLTKSEYRHVVRDLTGGVVSDAGRYLPTEGGAGEGFANVGEAQGITPALVEQYVAAAKDTLRHLRVYPQIGMVWSGVSREPINEPSAARQDVINEIIGWYVGQQQQWGANHRDDLSARFGNAHVAYLEAAWRYRYRAVLGRESASLADFATCEEIRLAPIALEKWWSILHDTQESAPFADWAAAWRALPGPEKLTGSKLRTACLGIVNGMNDSSVAASSADFAPPYEISFHEAKEEVLAAAQNEGRWLFRIDIGDAQELFLIVTDAGDGSRGEYAVWRRGRLVYRDGTSRSWQETVEVVGVNSGRKFPWGVDGEGAKRLGPDCIGVRPPGALKFAVPPQATVFEVDLTLDENRTKQASIQALVLKAKPSSQSYIPGRYVFGGRQRVVPRETNFKERDRLLRLRNVSEANRTKVGLNAERNILATWARTPLKHLGGPWPEHDADVEVPRAPYHYTAEQVRRNATAEDLARLTQLENRLTAVAQSPEQAMVALLRTAGIDDAKEGVTPDDAVIAKLDPALRERLKPLLDDVARNEATSESTARDLLSHFAQRAWRRPVDQNELALLMQLYRQERASGVSFDSAVKSPLTLVLVSPYFLYRGAISEPMRAVATPINPDTVVPLGPYELASRLSFFLWASQPDEELLTLSAADRIRDSTQLVTQARRMLRHPLGAALATDFAGQLWAFSDFDSFVGPDLERFPEFTPELRRSMHAELTTFLADLMQNDRPLTALIDADYTFVDDRLAEHYGLRDRPGATPRRVSLPQDRGGLPAMGLFLTQTSLPLRTSPVQRGVWIVERLLGRRIPTPPANVGKISDDERSAAGLSIREQLRIHRSEATCAACHARIDAFGVALENFDPIGRWRTALRDGAPLTKVESTHDGVTIDGFVGLRQYLVDHRDEVLAHFNRKLLGYALGRAVLPGDTELLERLNAGLPEHEYRLSFLVETIVTSPQFLNRRIAMKAAASN